MTDVLIGADIGGTSTRVAVADLTGRLLGWAQTEAGNPNAVGVATAAERIRRAAESALRQAEGSSSPADQPAPSPRPEPSPRPAPGAGLTVRAAVLGMAGYRTAQAAGPDFFQAALPIGAEVARLVSDLGVAYASATPAPHGYVLIAGTGSSAAEIEAGEIVARRGGWGWLLGDEGAGFWLGREAVRHAITEVERGIPRSALTQQVLADLARIDGAEPAGDALELLLRAPYQRPAVQLAELAPAVTGLVDQDPAAVAICAQAAERLSRLLLDLEPRPGRPIVTAGSVLRPDGVIHRALSEQLGTALAAPVLSATSGLVGGLWLAAGDAANGWPDPGVHERLTSTVEAGIGG